MRRFASTLIALGVMVAGAQAALAQPGSGTAGQVQASPDGSDVVARLRAQLVALEPRLHKASTTQAKLGKTYDAELSAVDKLKRQRASWRRDAQLRDQLAASLRTAKSLETVGREVAALRRERAAVAVALLAAIDRERALGPGAARVRDLDAIAKVARVWVPRRSKKLTVPDGRVDPLADPEELDLQAQALREAEAELARQVEALTLQAAGLERAARLREAHERAGVLTQRDGDAPRHGPAVAVRGNVEGDATSAPAPTDGFGEEPSNAGDPGVVLAEVVEPQLLEALRRSDQSPDLRARASARARVRDQAQARLLQLQKQRAAVEARAKTLR